MSERCEAYAPKSDPEKDARYWKNGAQGLPILSKMMLSLYEDSGSVWNWYDKHLSEQQEAIKMRQMYTHVLPVQDATPGKGNETWERQREYLTMKKVQEAQPRFGTLEYMIKQAETEAPGQ